MLWEWQITEMNRPKEDLTYKLIARKYVDTKMGQKTCCQKKRAALKPYFVDFYNLYFSKANVRTSFSVWREKRLCLLLRVTSSFVKKRLSSTTVNRTCKLCHSVEAFQRFFFAMLVFTVCSASSMRFQSNGRFLAKGASGQLQIQAKEGPLFSATPFNWRRAVQQTFARFLSFRSRFWS